MFAALARKLIARARRLYADEPGALDLDAPVYAVDSTLIDLSLAFGSVSQLDGHRCDREAAGQRSALIWPCYMQLCHVEEASARSMVTSA